MSVYEQMAGTTLRKHFVSLGCLNHIIIQPEHSSYIGLVRRTGELMETFLQIELSL